MLELRPVTLTDVDPEDVSFSPILEKRGYVAVPTVDVQRYTQSTLTNIGLGFVAGVAVGALFGNLFAKRSR